MSKLSFRARPLEASKPMPIYMSEELPDLPEYSAINRAVPQMPSGMKKEEECEHHLQRAMVTGLIIPTPEVSSIGDMSLYDRLYPPTFKVSRQLIHMQPFTMEHDIPDYDMDSEDEKWLAVHSKTLDVNELKFEEMMDRLEKNSGHSVVTQAEAKILLKEDDDLIIAVYDYWLNKRLKTQQSLIPCVKTESHRGGNSNNNPYLAFRRRTEKMQTRKNRKNDESTYEKMVKLKRDLTRAVTLLDLVKRRETAKREHLQLTVDILDKRFHAQDFSGALLSEVSAMKTSRPAFAPIYTNQYNHGGHGSSWSKPSKDDFVPRKEKRQYKKRKHKPSLVVNDGVNVVSSGDDDCHIISPTSPTQDDSPFVFRRKRQCLYQAPVSSGLGNWPWCSKEEGGLADQRFRFSLTTINTPTGPRCIGLARRRVGRGGRVILDRAGPSMDDFWASLDFTIHGNSQETVASNERLQTSETALTDDRYLQPDYFQDWPHFRPKSPTKTELEEEEVVDALSTNPLSLLVEDLNEPTNDPTPINLNLHDLFPSLVFDNSDQEGRRDDLDTLTPPSDLDSGYQSVESQRLSESSTSDFFNSKLTTKLNESDFDTSSSRNLKRTYIDKKEYQNQSGSLLDRWARCENVPPEPVKTKKVVTTEPFLCDEALGCSAFRTTNCWPESKLRTISESSSIVPSSIDEQLETTVVVDDVPVLPATPPKETKTPPPATGSISHRVNNISLHTNGPVNLDRTNNLSKQLGSSVSYHKKNNHLYVHNHGLNNKLIMRIPENRGDILETTVISSQVIPDKNSNEAVLRKSTQVPMEVT